MSLNLDARQRAMLQEMGITVWAPPPARPAPATAPTVPTALDGVTPPGAAAVGTAATTHTTARPAPGAQAATPAVPAPTAGTPRRPAAPAATSAPAVAPSASRPGAAPAGLLLRTPLALYPQADPAATPAELGAGWLVVLESHPANQPLADDAGKLLDNMLRAMRLHRHPRTYLATLARPAPGLPAEGAQPAAAGLQQALDTLRPSLVLVLGLGAARVVLDSREPLGRLRANVHHLADGTPAVVSYDPAYLLRAPEAKAAAWADLCRALAVVRRSVTA